MLEPTVAPYGAWQSLVRIDDVVGDVIVLGEPWIDGDDVYWLEGRPAEAGRRVLVRAAADGSTADLTPPPFNVRTRVHEYGGGSYVVGGGIVVFSEFGDGRLYRLDPGATEAVPITPPGPWRYADLRPDLARRRFYAVREDHSAGEGDHEAVVNTIVAVPLDGGDPVVLVSGPDFVASPRLAPDGTRLCWLEWDHPDMPWDATRLRVALIEPDGSLGESTLAAGGPDESIVQPEWGPDGTLHLISDRSGWWNLYRIVEGPRLEPLAPMEAEFADPSWIFDRSSYGFLADGSIAAVGRLGGSDRLFHVGVRGAHRGARDPVYGARRAADRPKLPGRPGRRPDRSGRCRALRSGDPGRVRRPAPGEHGDARPGDDLAPRADRVPDRRRADRPRALLPAHQPGVHWPGR